MERTFMFFWTNVMKKLSNMIFKTFWLFFLVLCTSFQIQMITFIQTFVEIINYFLVWFTIPNSIACNNHYFKIIINIACLYFWDNWYLLFFWLETSIIFELFISNSSWECKHAINSVLKCITSSLLNSHFLLVVLRFMINRHGFSIELSIQSPFWWRAYFITFNSNNTTTVS